MCAAQADGLLKVAIRGQVKLLVNSDDRGPSGSALDPRQWLAGRVDLSVQGLVHHLGLDFSNLNVVTRDPCFSGRCKLPQGIWGFG